MQPERVLITGASGAIGAALARCYAAAGGTLLLQGRDQAVLAEVAEECRAAGATVHTYSLDLCEIDTVIDWLDGLFAQQPIDLFIANAGMNINIGDDQAGESLNQMAQLLDLNVKATLLMTGYIAQQMRARKQGQIALISSLAAFYGLPVTPSYSASKAAIKAYGEALRGWLAPAGVGVTVVMPGYVESAMCHAMPGPKPFVWHPDKAARVIQRGIARNRPRISFPFPLNVGTWCLSVLPPELSERILRLLNYSGSR